MKNATFASLNELLDEIGRSLMHAVRQGARAVGRMSWPQLLAACVMLALVLTILPLAICLFIFFMIVKLAVAAIVINTRRNKD